MPNAKEHAGGREEVPYCRFCADKNGKLLPFETVHENMTVERFMKVNGMPRKGAEEHARRALEAMPLWKNHRQ
jgi:ABC-type polar amino acid transport system ATPase subunit